MDYQTPSHIEPLIIPFGGKQPVIAADAFIAPGAVLIGDVVVGSRSSIWFGCVLRADEAPIHIGDRSNLQDGTIIHVNGGVQGTFIGNDVSVGHACLLHACTLDDNSYVGMGAQIFDGAKVEGGGMLAGGSLLTPGKVVPRGELWGGRPASLMREITPEHAKSLAKTPVNYAEKGQLFMKELVKMD